MQQTYRRQPSLVGPLLLLGTGVLLLLGNFGLLGWNVWEAVFRLWPLVLVAVGVDILIGRRSTVGALIAALVIVTMFAAALFLFTFTPFSAPAPTTQSLSQPLGGASRADVTLNLGAGALTIGATDSTANLVEGTVTLNSTERLEQSLSLRDQTAYLVIRGQRSEDFPLFFTRYAGENWALRLTTAVPLALTINAGAGTNTLDLTQLHLTDLRLNSGVGTTVLTLPATGQLQATLKGGIGETVIYSPAGMAARIHARNGLGQTSVPDNFRRSGDVYVSPEFENAFNRVELNVTGGIGAIRIAVQP